MVDKEAIFIYVPFSEVLEKAKTLNTIPFDISKVELTHSAVDIMAKIVRGADTDQHDLAPQTVGLWDISTDLAFNITDDYQLLDKRMSFMMPCTVGLKTFKIKNTYKIQLSIYSLKFIKNIGITTINKNSKS